MICGGWPRMNGIVCPKCNSIKVQVYEKEEYISWIGDLKILRCKRGEKKDLKNVNACNVAMLFPT